MDVPSLWETVARLAMSVAFGALIGWEREAKAKPAGLKTHSLVSLGAAAYTLLTWKIAAGVGGIEAVTADPLRLINGLVGGIGFLGGGAIIQSRGSVAGITTASTIWLTGSIGVACGAGFYEIAGITIVLSFIVLRLLVLLERRFEHLADEDDEAADGGG